MSTKLIEETEQILKNLSGGACECAKVVMVAKGNSPEMLKDDLFKDIF